MADNKPVRDGDNVSFNGAADELSDGSFSPKVTLLSGDATPTAISPATSGRQDTTNSKLDTIHSDLAPRATKALTNVAVSASASGENTLVSGTASQTIRVFRLMVQAASPVTLTFKDAAGGNTLHVVTLGALGTFEFDTVESGEPMWVTASAGAFIMSLSAAVAVTGSAQYTKSA